MMVVLRQNFELSPGASGRNAVTFKGTDPEFSAVFSDSVVCIISISSRYPACKVKRKFDLSK
jgi:hypothetical protein